MIYFLHLSRFSLSSHLGTPTEKHEYRYNTDTFFTGVLILSLGNIQNSCTSGETKTVRLGNVRLENESIII